MSKRSFTARQALAALLAAVCLPFLSIAKPPDLPTTSKVECKEESTGKTLFGAGVNSDAGIIGTIHCPESTVPLQHVLRIFCRGKDPDALWPFGTKFKILEAGGSIIFTPFNDVHDHLEDLIDPLRPRLEDLLESSWRTLSRWLPITCSPDCCEARTSRLAVIEVLSFAPTLQEENPNRRISELLNTSEHSGPIEYEWQRIWFTDQPSHLTPQRVHGGISSGDEVAPPQCERLTVMPVPVIPARVGEIKIVGCLLPSSCGMIERLDVMPTPVSPAPQAAVRELPFAQFMCLVEDHWELLPLPIQCGGSFPGQATPRRIMFLRDVNEPPCCVEDNLIRLTRAQQLCREAENCCKAGNTCAAVRCFAEAAQLCPGSACAAACAARLRELIAGQAQTIIQTSAKEVKEDEKQSSGPRIEIKLTIEIKR